MFPSASVAQDHDHGTPLERDSASFSRAARAARTEELLEELRGCADEADREAVRERLVLVNRGVAEAVAARYRGRGIPDDDLVQVAYLGLVKAVARFDPDRGHDLLTFAVPTVRGELTRHFRDHGWAVRPPRRVQELQGRINPTIEALGQRLGRDPDSGEVAAELGVPRATCDEAFAAYGCFAPRSLDRPVGDDSAPTLGELLPADDAAASGSMEARLVLAPLVRALSERERRILYLRYFEELTQEEIGMEVGVSQVQVSRLLTRILADLRSALA